MPYMLKKKKRAWLLLAALLLASCSTTPPQPSTPEVVACLRTPPLSDELKTEPKPSGSYLGNVTEWRKAWAQKLKDLQPK
jgi:hypothetical protein